MLVDRALTKLTREFPEIAIEKVDVMAHPRRVWNAGIRMIPALKNQERILAGILLNEKEIRAFLAEVQ